MQRSARAKNVVIALSLIAAVGLLVYRRVLPLVLDFSRYSDGNRGFARASDPALRHFAWDAARPLAQALAGGEIDGAGRESSVAWSPDGRWLVFAAGAIGARDLFVAELDGGQVRDASPLSAINSAADDCAPAFGDGELCFASDRDGGAGGFDLYESAWSDGDAREVQPLAHVNTVADELDPAPRGDRLLFTSNRERDGRHDFNLFARNREGLVSELASLNSQRDEREPSLASDGRCLYFASDREGGFDLFRAFEHEQAWLAPEPLADLNSDAAERGPSLTADGMRIAFVRELAGDAATNDVWLARAREVARIPNGPAGWYDLALAAALLTLALLAWVSKRWEHLDFIYKCFLASLLIHLLLMLWFRYVHPEAGGLDTPQRGGDTFRVRLLPDEQRQRALRENAGELRMTRAGEALPEMPERVEIEVALAEVAPTRASELSAARAELAPSPERAAVVTERSREIARAEPSLATPSEDFERRDAPQAALEFAPSVVDAREGVVVDALARAELATPSNSPMVSAPSAGIVVAETNTGAELDAPTRFTPDALGPASSSSLATSSPQLAVPGAETSRRLADAAVGPNVEARSFAGSRENATTSNDAAPTRESESNALSASQPHEVSASAPSSLDARRSNATAEFTREFAPSGVQRSGAGTATTSMPKLATPRDESTRGALAEAPTDALPAAREFGPGRSTTDAPAGGPAQLEPSSSSRLAASPSSPSAPSAAAPLSAAPRANELDSPRAPPPLADTPYRNRFGAEKEIALRELGGTVETERAVALGLSYLAARQQRDGGWGDPSDAHEKYRDVRIGKTGLALLAFLGAGHTPSSGTVHSRVAARAVERLLRAQDPTTGHFGNSEAYSHGIATYALGECFAITRDERLRAPLERAIEQIVRHQLTRGGERRAGGWSYYYPDGATFDPWPRTSITSWQVMALESARLGGIAVPDATFEAAARFLVAAWDGERGAFRYSHDPQRLSSGYSTLPGSTPAALFALSLLGEDLASPRWSAALDFVTSRAPREYRFAGDDEFVTDAAGNLYFWYYASLALLRRGGDAWERWNESLKTTVLPAQREDGSWAPIDIYSRYAGDEDGDAVYSTAMCVLTLEVYYRYFTPLLRVR